MYDLENFTRENMYDCAIKLRNMDVGAKDMEEIANRMVHYLYENLIDRKTKQPACALVRCFKTHPYGRLDAALQASAREILEGRPITANTKCLTLLATMGDEPQWNSRQFSTGHKAIPLIDEDFVERAPMISQLIHQFGLRINTVLEPDIATLVDLYHMSFNVFYIPEALGSPHIPAQSEFVIPYQIKSVLGFGGMLPSGDLLALILFSKSRISRDTASLFKWISAYVRIAASSYDRETVLAGSK
ncbi:hypothetical protein IFO70_30510 [Phormidium tenue FACHB-886]|nr:hypothetical protein [Phormidium tenue FACHB-886]